MGSKGIVASTAAMSVLLQEGIGDTIRVSLTPEPGGKRTQEVVVAQEMLQTMGLRAFMPMVAACPGCGRTTSSFFQELAQSIQEHVRSKMPQWRVEYDGVENMTLAVMGCIVNGPGESKHANIGISLPGTGEAPAAPVPRTTRRPPRRRRTGSAGWEAAAGAAFTAAAESALDTVELSVPSLTKPSRLSVGTMLLAARCITTPISRPIRLSHTTLSPWPHENAPRKGNFVSSLSCGWRTPALALSHSQEPQGDRRHLAR